MAVHPSPADAQKLQDSRTSWADIEARWPGSVVTHRDGKREASIPLAPDTAEGRRNRGSLLEMVAPSARLETEQSLNRAAGTDHKAIAEAGLQRAGERSRPGFSMSGPAWDRFFRLRKRRKARS